MNSVKTVTEKAREIPVIKEVDVLVVGGGYAGVGAAMCAARNGAETMLVERFCALGGLVTMGYVALTFSYLEGTAHELFERLKKMNGLKGRFVDPEKTKIVLEEMLIDEGVGLMFDTSVVDTIVEDNEAQGVVVFSRGGKQAILAKRIIDASGDGDVAAFAGVPFESGCPEYKNYNQATSLVCRIGNVNYEKYLASGMNDMKKWEKMFLEAVENDEFPFLIDKRVNWFVKTPDRDPKHQEIFICYAHSRNCDCLDGLDITRQLIEQRRQNLLFLEFLRKHVPGYEKAWLIDTAPLLGVRESRRIMCEYKVTVDDIIEGRIFPDAIMRGCHPLDCHHPTSPGHIKHVVRKDEKGESVRKYVNPGSWREIPYRAIVPLKVENMLVAGRNFSADFMAQSGNRLVMECYNMGQAAGTAAALSLIDNVVPRQLNPERLRKKLCEMNINLYKDPIYGAMRVTSKVDSKDLDIPNDPTYSISATIKKEAANNYRCLSYEEADGIAKGYTDSGGDVGTNLE